MNVERSRGIARLGDRSATDAAVAATATRATRARVAPGRVAALTTSTTARASR